MIRRLLVATLVLLSAPMLLFAAEPFSIGSIIIEKPWSRASIGTMRPTAAFFTIRNTGTEPDRLLSVHSAAAGMTEIHETTEKDGMMRMSPVGALDLPPGEAVELKPGGKHIMLMRLHAPLTEGETTALELTFEKAGKLLITLPVLSAGASGAM